MTERVPPPPPIDAPRPSPRRRRFLFVGFALVLPIVALIGIAAVFLQVAGWSSFRQASGSMRPSILPDERFFVDMRAYRTGRHPDYGDIITFWIPTEVIGAAGPNVTFVMRVVGLPGDRVDVTAGVISVNGRPLPQEQLGELDAGRPGRNEKALWLRERAPNGATYDIMRYRSVRNPDAAAGGSYVVPAGRYFVMGDNRDDSLGSRYWGAARWLVFAQGQYHRPSDLHILVGPRPRGHGPEMTRMQRSHAAVRRETGPSGPAIAAARMDWYGDDGRG